MAALLEERQKRQREMRNEMDANSVKSRKVGVSDSRNLQSLVESVKRKSVESEVGQGKRRKL